MKYIYLILLSLCCTTFATETAELSSLESLVQQWVNLRREIAQEQQNRSRRKNQWQMEMSLLTKESKRLDKQIAAANKFKAGNADKIASDLERKKMLQKSLDNAADVVTRLTTNICEIIKQIPPSLLSENLKSIDAKDANIKLPVTKQIQITVSALSEIEKLENSIHSVSEIIDIDNSRRKMDVIYPGLSCGFAVSSDNSIAAVGRPNAAGWKWQSSPEIAAEVRRLVDIKNHELPPQLVTLPLPGTVREVQQ
jgi:hypothetical protein